MPFKQTATKAHAVVFKFSFLNIAIDKDGSLRTGCRLFHWHSIKKSMRPMVLVDVAGTKRSPHAADQNDNVLCYNTSIIQLHNLIIFL